MAVAKCLSVSVALYRRYLYDMTLFYRFHLRPFLVFILQ